MVPHATVGGPIETAGSKEEITESPSPSLPDPCMLHCPIDWNVFRQGERGWMESVQGLNAPPQADSAACPGGRPAAGVRINMDDGAALTGILVCLKKPCWRFSFKLHISTPCPGWSSPPQMHLACYLPTTAQRTPGMSMSPRPGNYKGCCASFPFLDKLVLVLIPPTPKDGRVGQSSGQIIRGREGTLSRKRSWPYVDAWSLRA